ncbi:MAG: hypothetical protein WDM78_05050 [Puia sp.]
MVTWVALAYSSPGKFLKIKLQWTSFYAHGVIILSVFGIAGAIFSLLYFAARHRAINAEESVKPLYAEQII